MLTFLGCGLAIKGSFVCQLLLSHLSLCALDEHQGLRHLKQLEQPLRILLITRFKLRGGRVLRISIAILHLLIGNIVPYSEGSGAEHLNSSQLLSSTKQLALLTKLLQIITGIIRMTYISKNLKQIVHLCPIFIKGFHVHPHEAVPVKWRHLGEFK